MEMVSVRKLKLIHVEINFFSGKFNIAVKRNSPLVVRLLSTEVVGATEKRREYWTN